MYLGLVADFRSGIPFSTLILFLILFPPILKIWPIWHYIIGFILSLATPFLTRPPYIHFSDIPLFQIDISRCLPRSAIIAKSGERCPFRVLNFYIFCWFCNVKFWFLANSLQIFGNFLFDFHETLLRGLERKFREPLFQGDPLFLSFWSLLSECGPIFSINFQNLDFLDMGLLLGLEILD